MWEIIAIFPLGLIMGSFANMAIWRLQTISDLKLQISNLKRRKSQAKEKISNLQAALSNLSIVKGRSMCPDCLHQLRAKDLLPLLSWLSLAGKCRYCKKAISLQYPLVEITMAVLFGLSYVAWNFAGTISYIQLGIWLLIVVGLIVLAVSDLRWMILPDAAQYGVGGLALLFLFTEAASGANWITWGSPLLAATVFGGFFFTLFYLSGGKWMGGGDVKLAINMGLLLGLAKGLVAFMLAFNIAAILSLILLATKLRSRKDLIPFGPFLIGGTIIAKLWGEEITNIYLRVAGLQ